MKRLVLALIAMALMALPTYPGDFVSGSAACPSSGNAQVSTTSYQLMQLTVSSLTSNSGIIYVGGSNVSITTGGQLCAGCSYNSTSQANSINPATLYFACSNSGDSITWVGRR